MVTFWATSVPVFVNVTAALAITALDVSVTAPRMVAVVTCVCALLRPNMTSSNVSGTGIAARLHVFQVLDITHFPRMRALPAAESTVSCEQGFPEIQ